MSHPNHSLALRVVLFVIGLAILVTALFLLLPYRTINGSAALFTTVDAIVLYAVIFAPLLMDWDKDTLAVGKVASMGIVWRAIVPYTVVTLMVLYYTNSMPYPPLKLLLVVQLVAAFGLAIALYLARETEAHISDVAHEELAVRSSVTRLRTMADQLVTAAAYLDPQEGGTAKELVTLVDRIAEELRYTTPVHTEEALALERHIATNIDELTARLGAYDFDGTHAEYEVALARDTLVVIGQRRRMLN